MTGQGTVVRAFVYLQAYTTWNALMQRLRRLRQPKYLFGALAGGAYMYFFFFRRLLRPGFGAPPFDGLPGLSEQLPLIAGLGLFVIVALSWLVPSGRAALQLSEAEVAFLFPAPMTRGMLIQFKLLRSQLAIFISAFLMSLLFRRGVAMGGNPVLHAISWWLILSTLNLHFLGASFTRERLLELGINPLRRLLLFSGLLIALGLGCWWWLRTRLQAPTADDLAGIGGLINYAGSVLSSAPLSWLLTPFKWVAAPLFAADAASFWPALVPALLLLVAHYVWVVHSEVSFEEASIDLARRRAERVLAMRDGKFRLRNTTSKPRTAPFRLAATGFTPIAFLWKGLIALGPFWRLRTWLIACALVLVVGGWLAADPSRRPFLHAIGAISAGFGVWMFLAAPMFMQRGIRQTLDQIDILKASPLRGWQIVLGELSSPMVLIVFTQWLLLLVVAISFGTDSSAVWMTAANIVMAAVAITVIAPPLCGLMLCVPFAGLLYFPAWTMASGSRGGGIEVIGQRMIFLGAYVLLLALSLVPVVILGGLVFLLVKWLLGIVLALFLTALVSGITLGVELAAAIWWLGERVERFDLSEATQP